MPRPAQQCAIPVLHCRAACGGFRPDTVGEQPGLLIVSVGAGLEVSVETPKENPLLTGMLTDSVDMEVSGDTPKENPVVLFFSSSTGSVVVDPPKINPLGDWSAQRFCGCWLV